MAIDLLTPVIQQDHINNINFFNGRLLTAEDLHDEQAANRKQRQLLGQAIGCGVVQGLQITDTSSTKNGVQVTITPGIAINGWGQAMQLKQSIDLSLSGNASEQTCACEFFKNCEDTPVVDLYNGTTSIYVLTISPAAEFKGNVPVFELTDNKAMTGCGRRYVTEGVKFNLVGLYHQELSGDICDRIQSLLEKDDEHIPRLSKLRNNLVHLCLGTEELAQFSANPFLRAENTSAFKVHGLQKIVELTRCEVPIALIHLTQKGIRFIDTWAVRRRPNPPPPSENWPISVGSKRQAENEAAFLQFQDHWTWLMAEKLMGNISNTKLLDYFDYLPAAGFLWQAHADGESKNYDPVLSGIIHNQDEIYISGTHLNEALNRSFYYHPIDLKHEPKLIIYHTRENIAAKDSAPPFILFTSPFMPFLEMSCFEYGIWDNSLFNL